jgi:hypothetical protein
MPFSCAMIGAMRWVLPRLSAALPELNWRAIVATPERVGSSI